MVMMPSHSDRPARLLVAMFQGGGNIPLILPVVAALAVRGHDVRVLAGPGVRGGRLPISDRFLARIAATGARYVPFAMPPVPPIYTAIARRGLVRGWVPARLADATGNAPTLAWSPAWAANVAAELRRAPADAVIADYILLGALAAAEASDVPAVALVHGTYKHRPAPGLPARGPGFLPARSPLGRLRDALYNAATLRIFRRDGLPYHNRARRDLGLPPLRSPFGQYDRAARVLILCSAAFDFPIRRLPPNVHYVGAPGDDADAAWADPWPATDARPLVLVSLSTLPQGQTALMRRILVALEGLPVRALVTLGPALADTPFDAPANTRLVSFAPHGAVLPRAAVLVTQCGMSTVAKALAHGVPMVCLPLQGDQPDNAARVVARGAGIRLHCDASPGDIGDAIRRVVKEPRYREGARRLAAAMAAEDAAGTAAAEIEELVGLGRLGMAG